FLAVFFAAFFAGAFLAAFFLAVPFLAAFFAGAFLAAFFLAVPFLAAFFFAPPFLAVFLVAAFFAVFFAAICGPPTWPPYAGSRRATDVARRIVPSMARRQQQIFDHLEGCGNRARRWVANLAIGCSRRSP